MKVDVESPNLDEFPLFADAEFLEAVLGPGECLYIPVSPHKDVVYGSVDGGIL
jgi:hypothetical protein